MDRKLEQVDTLNFTEEQLKEIEEIKDHFAYEIDLAVLELDEAMYVAMVSFAFPFQILIGYIFANMTNRNFILRFSQMFDIAVFICVLIWFEKFEEYLHADNTGFSLQDPPKWQAVFMQ